MTSLRPQVSVIIPAYGPSGPIVAAVERLLGESAVHIEIVVVDNDPARGLRAALPSAPRLRLVEPGFNTGFAGGINRGIDASSGEFVLFHNADLLLDETYLPALTKFMRSHPNAGAATGKVVRPPSSDDGALPTIDSAGIAVRRDRGAFDRGEGRPDDGSFDVDEEVFAVSGAALFARRSALDDIAIDRQYLDEAFFMYKDDVDLCWRMRRRGWECWYVPSGVAFHVRSGRGLGGRGYAAAARRYLANERRKAPHVRLHSLKNEWLMLARNDSARNLITDSPWILGRQVLLVAVTALVSPKLLVRAVRFFGGSLPGATRWRRAIDRRAVVDSGSLRARWFNG